MDRKEAASNELVEGLGRSRDLKKTHASNPNLIFEIGSKERSNK